MTVWWAVLHAQRLGECKAEPLIPGRKRSPSLGNSGVCADVPPASPHQAHFPFVQTSLEGDGFRIANVVPVATSLGILCSLLPALNGAQLPRALPSPQGSGSLYTGSVPPRGSHLGSRTGSSVCPLRRWPRCSLPALPSAPTRPCQSAVAWRVPVLQEPTPEPSVSPFTQASRQGKPSQLCVPASAPVYFWAVGFTSSFIP